MKQRELIEEIKRVKWELRQSFNSQQLIRLYKLIDELQPEPIEEKKDG